MNSAPLSPEQGSVLQSAYSTLRSMSIYLRVVVPAVDGTDEQLLEGLIELAEISLRHLPKYFPELIELASERERGGQ